MAFKIRRVDYYYTMVDDHPGEAYQLLNRLAKLGVNLLAVNGVPVGAERTQMTLFPENSNKLTDAAKNAGILLDGPHRALLVQGDDEMGALAAVHAKLYNAKVNVFASSCVTDGRGAYGYILYVRPDEYERASKALEV
ncbi:MAG: hypothetical protein HZB25_12080 [Candidatus Eisenbacteria bacterium]|nr:hypothetical protein [Candidatus Eisenbacteria bacterium]